MPDLYFYRDPEEVDQAVADESKTAPSATEDAVEVTAADADADWNAETNVEDWADSGVTPAGEEAAASNW